MSAQLYLSSSHEPASWSPHRRRAGGGWWWWGLAEDRNQSVRRHWRADTTCDMCTRAWNEGYVVRSLMIIALIGDFSVIVKLRVIFSNLRFKLYCALPGAGTPVTVTMLGT